MAGNEEAVGALAAEWRAAKQEGKTEEGELKRLRDEAAAHASPADGGRGGGGADRLAWEGGAAAAHGQGL